MFMLKYRKPLKSLSLCLILSFFACKTGQSQPVLLFESGTEQRWAGGICCRSGVNYTFQLTSTDTTLRLDSIWLGETAIPVVYGNAAVGETQNCFPEIRRGKLYIMLRTGISSNYMPYELNPIEPAHTKPSRPEDAPAGNFVSYHRNGIRLYCMLGALQEFPPLAYP